jgi:hypothetical protein
MNKSTEALVEHGQITKAQLDLAIRLRSKHGGTIGYHLIGVGAIDNDVLADFYAGLNNTPRWHRPELQNISSQVIKLVPSKLIAQHRILPIVLDDENLSLGMTDPDQAKVIEQVTFYTGCLVKPVVISEKDMAWGMETYYDIKPTGADYEDSDPPAEPGYVQTTTKQPPDIAAFRVPTQDPVGSSSFPNQPQSRYASESPGVRVQAPIRVSHPPAPRPNRRSLIPNPVSHEKKPDEKVSQGSLIAAIHKAPTRNAIVDYSLQYLLQFAERSAFFVVKKDKIEGFDIAGESTSRTAMRSYWAPLSTSSTLSRLVTDKGIHIGPLGRSSADSILAAALGGRPDRIIAIPVAIGKRVVGILYADKIQSNMPTFNNLKRLGEVAGENFARLLRTKSSR